jgi:hypothetical protein
MNRCGRILDPLSSRSIKASRPLEEIVGYALRWRYDARSSTQQGGLPLERCCAEKNHRFAGEVASCDARIGFFVE